MKRIIALILGLTLAFTMTLTGCGGGGEDSYCDDAFLKDLAKGLEARWDFTNQDNFDLEEDEIMTTAVNKELDVIGSYTEGKFENKTLQEYAIAYINALNKQLEAVDYYDADYDKYYNMFDEAYIERCQLIVKINEEFGIPVSSKYQDDLKDLTRTGGKANEKDAIREALEKQIADAEVFREEDDLVMVVENTTDKTIKDVDFQIQYIDADGVKTETDDCFIEDWKPGEKTRVTWWVYDVSYDKYEITVDYIEY